MVSGAAELAQGFGHRGKEPAHPSPQGYLRPSAAAELARRAPADPLPIWAADMACPR